MSERTVHVIKSSNGRWSILRDKSDRATRVFSTQNAAIEQARRMAKQGSARLFVHRSDGTIASADSYYAAPSKQQRLSIRSMGTRTTRSARKKK